MNQFRSNKFRLWLVGLLIIIAIGFSQSIRNQLIQNIINLHLISESNRELTWFLSSIESSDNTRVRLVVLRLYLVNDNWISAIEMARKYPELKTSLGDNFREMLALAFLKHGDMASALSLKPYSFAFYTSIWEMTRDEFWLSKIISFNPESLYLTDPFLKKFTVTSLDILVKHEVFTNQQSAQIKTVLSISQDLKNEQSLFWNFQTRSSDDFKHALFVGEAGNDISDMVWISALRWQHPQNSQFPYAEFTRALMMRPKKRYSLSMNFKTTNMTEGNAEIILMEYTPNSRYTFTHKVLGQTDGVWNELTVTAISPDFELIPTLILRNAGNGTIWFGNITFIPVD
jgi:hypothetical protein